MPSSHPPERAFHTSNIIRNTLTVYIYTVIIIVVVMFRRQQDSRTPPLTCGECSEPVVKTADGRFVCVSCDYAYHTQTGQQPRSIETALAESGGRSRR